MTQTGWLQELPTVAQAMERAAAGERKQEQLERARLAAEKERVAESVAAAEVGVWVERFAGRALPTESEVLARGREDVSGDQDRLRRSRAREILRQHGLEDVLGGWSGTVFDQNLGCLEPQRDEVQRSAADVEDAENAALVARYHADRRAVENIIRSRRDRSPFVRRSTVARSEDCVYCTEEGLDDQTSYLLHSDPEFNLPVTSPAEKAEADRRQAEADRLQSEGFTARTARYAAGMVVR